jgi:uncharacterized protein YicC (UPF0701 family)
MPLRRTSADDSDAQSWVEVHSSDEEREAAQAAITALTDETLRRAQGVAEERGVQLAELLSGTGWRLQEQVVKLMSEQPVWRPSDD